MDEALDTTQKTVSRLREWFMVCVTIASWIFLAGMFYVKVDAMGSEIERMKSELARKDVIEQQLRSIDSQLTNLENKFDQLLRLK